MSGVTDEQIGQLANEAARAGDHAMVEICEIALGAGDVGVHATDREQRVAREECARVIAEAEAAS